MKSDSYSRRTLLATLGALGLGGAAALTLRQPAPVEKALDALEALPAGERMPAVFVGHGTPRSALAPNLWTDEWGRIGSALPRPVAILAISAHWLTEGGALVTASESPSMNYDVFGFPKELYEFRYPAPGSPAAAREVASALDGHIPVMPDTSWGFDHGTWLVMKYMFPKADIPLLQLSIDYSRPPAFHYELGTKLRALRDKGILIVGSGNVVHNLSVRPDATVTLGGAGVTTSPRDWAVEFDRRMATAVMNGNHAEVVGFQSLGPLASQAHPTHDHFLPLLYTLGLVEATSEITTFNEGFQWPGISMRSFVVV